MIIYHKLIYFVAMATSKMTNGMITKSTMNVKIPVWKGKQQLLQMYIHDNYYCHILSQVKALANSFLTDC